MTAAASLKSAAIPTTDLPIMAGVVTYEGYAYFAQADLTAPRQADSNGTTGLHELTAADRTSRSSNVLRTYVHNVFRFHRQKIYDILAHNYHDWENGGGGGGGGGGTGGGGVKRTEHSNGGRRVSSSLVELIGDGQITSPVVRLVQKLANCNRGGIGTTHGGGDRTHVKPTIYFYNFGSRPRTSAERSRTDWDTERGVYGEDIQYILGAPIIDGIDPFPAVYSGSEKILSETILRYWTNFMKTG